MSASSVLLFTATAAFLAFFRGETAFSLFGSLDPYCYHEYLYRLLHLPVAACPSQSFLPGTAIAWWPAAWVARELAPRLGIGVDHAILLSIAATAFALWIGALALGLVTVQEAAPRVPHPWAALWVLGTPVLYYCAVRPTLSHAPEFFLASLCAWLVVRRSFFPLLLAASAACLVRHNAVAWIAVAAAAAWSGGERRRSWWTLWTAAAILFAVRLFRVGFLTGYNEVRVPFLARSFTWHRVAEVLWGSDWGLIWTAPAWIAALAFGLGRARRVSPVGAAAVASMGAALALCFCWRGNGGDFGYRYLIGTWPMAMLLWLEAERTAPRVARALRALIALGALWTSVLTGLYRTSPDLTPRPARAGWGAVLPGYQRLALRSLGEPRRWREALSKTPLASAWCGWAECRSGRAVFGVQWAALAAATAAASAVLIGLALARIRRWRFRIWGRPLVSTGP